MLYYIMKNCHWFWFAWYEIEITDWRCPTHADLNGRSAPGLWEWPMGWIDLLSKRLTMTLGEHLPGPLLQGYFCRRLATRFETCHTGSIQQCGLLTHAYPTMLAPHPMFLSFCVIGHILQSSIQCNQNVNDTHPDQVSGPAPLQHHTLKRHSLETEWGWALHLVPMALPDVLNVCAWPHICLSQRPCVLTRICKMYVGLNLSANFGMAC